MKLPSNWMLPNSIEQRFGQRSSGKQRAMIAQEHLLLVLHRIPQPDKRTRQGVFFWRQPDGSWQSSNSVDNGLQALVKHLQSYSQAEEKYSEAYEDAQTSEDYFQILEGISPLRMATKNLHSTLQDAREGIPEDRNIIDMRDWAYEIDRSLDLLYENTKNALDFNLARRAEEQTKLSLASVRASNRLNILAAIFYPLTAISCVFGMNLTSGLESSHFVWFWLVTITAIGMGILVRGWVLKGKWSLFSNRHQEKS